MLRERRDVGINKQISVDENHLKDSPSLAARASETSSRFPIRHRPRSTVSEWKLAGCGLGAVSWVNPARNASFTACLKESRLVFLTFSRRIATSGSRLKVVLMHQSIIGLML